MPVWLHHIETIVPETVYTQEYAAERMQLFFEDARTRRLIRAIYRKSGIEKRHSVVTNFVDGGPGSFFEAGSGGKTIEPTTGRRNEIFARESQTLSVELARAAIANCPGTGPEKITHVVTVSCTGFHNPGLDYHIVSALGLRSSTQRYHLGFMGCYAAITGLRMAAQFCIADPEAMVLVVCLELCTLHLQLNGSEDSLMANSLFGDGAAAAVVGARPPGGGRHVYEVGDFMSALVPDGRAEMAWTIGNRGFDMTLSSYVPKIIGKNILPLVTSSLARHNLKTGDVTTWAVHPGGKAIIDRVAESLSLSPHQVRASREVLRRYGNMSSATILFVLKEILEHSSDHHRETVCAMAFGPGLTVEMCTLRSGKNEKGRA
ncbi:MAG: type III polyketide synthase [Deltaproteobacteria bacterium]|nr:type III polyketide synthase [Deltaproteobacteria bacterium]NIS77281.1 type III polyketide synthase [Deltaproteobacteria bacterium]